jgi:hypothetical protein
LRGAWDKRGGTDGPPSHPLRKESHKVGVGFSGGRGLLPFYADLATKPTFTVLRRFERPTFTELPFYQILPRRAARALHSHMHTVTAPSARRPPHTCQSCVHFGIEVEGVQQTFKLPEKSLPCIFEESVVAERRRD